MKINSNNLIVKLFGLVVMSLIFSGCTKGLLGTTNQEKETDKAMEFDVGAAVDDPEYIEVSEDDSLDALDKEIKETIFEDEDFSNLGI